MKWLVGLSAAQTVLLGFVALRVVSLEMRAGDIEDAADAARLAAQNSAQNSALSRPGATLVMPASANGAAIDIEAFRALIREEMAPVIAAQSTSTIQQTARAPHHTPEQVKRAEAEFTRNLNLVRSRGLSSDAAIDDLYAQIARMPPQARQEAMTQIAKAIRSGEIDARL